MEGMEYKKVINLLNNTTNIQPTRFRIENWDEVNDNVRGIYNTNSQMKLKTKILNSILCDYSEADILVTRTTAITGAGEGEDERHADQRNERVTFKNCVPITDYFSKVNMLKYKMQKT